MANLLTAALAWFGDFLAGYKTYLSAAGLVGLAVYQFSEGKYGEATASLLGAFGLVSSRVATAKAEMKADAIVVQPYYLPGDQRPSTWTKP